MTKFPLHVADVLQTAGDIVTHIGWTQRAFAKTADGYTADATSKDATCFCALGAIRLARSQAGRKYSERVFAEALQTVLPNYAKNSGIPLWNDAGSRTVEDVSEAFYSAAERIRAQHNK